ncbi:hypothetical protein FPZ24_14875 [Sphingomonas panacisoli]|uniref:DUF3828 domain-containing protein n=1 Tax=Sphingomonas panacisoli TaxID=1813879 RepID=A0A5B8LMC1_9SPHN|nr:hypothetical protein [Sphingomonas panacisoli]QDZ08592.1 hypothetical protein FPZ24_14875 [Sphingomonas panacisoli]
MKQALIALALIAAAPAPAGPAASAKAFVDSLYRPWIASLKRDSSADRTGYMPKDDESVYIPELSALLNKDQRISNRTGDVGVIDWVILCSCQDDGGLGYRVTIPVATAKTATAKVALSFGGKYDRTLTLKLMKLPAGWRIADVADTDMPSLLALLRKELRGKK